MAGRVGRRDRGRSRRGETAVREPSDARGVERPWPRLLGEHGGEAHERPGNSGPHRQAVRPHDGLPAPPAGGRENVLARDFEPTGPNEAWCADITFVGTREGWLYLAVVEDLFSRRIVGWSMAESMASRLVVDALSMAIARRRPGAGLLAHSDRGSQYASEHYQRVLAGEGIVCSMSGVGQCWDNAPGRELFRPDEVRDRWECDVRLEGHREGRDLRVPRSVL